MRTGPVSGVISAACESGVPDGAGGPSRSESGDTLGSSIGGHCYSGLDAPAANDHTHTHAYQDALR